LFINEGRGKTGIRGKKSVSRRVTKADFARWVPL